MILVVLALGWLGGMAATAVWDLGPWYGLAVGVALAPAVYVRLGPRDAVLCLAASVMALAGAVRLGEWLDRDLVALPTTGTELTIEGVIASEPDPGFNTIRYRVNIASIDGIPTDGAVLITVGQFDDYLPGDHVQVSGEIEEPPVFPDFDYRGYLQRQGIGGTMLFPRVEVTGSSDSWKRTAAEARLNVEQALQQSLPEPEASLAAGIGFGMDANLPADLYEDFRDAGLAHLVAVSGANVMYVAAFVFLLLTPWLGVRLATAPAAATILLYLVAAGLSASVIRAGIMAVVFLLGALLGRQRSSLAALGAAVIIMTASEPSAALDVGFQLSVAATAGLIVFAPWIRAGIELALSRVGIRDWVPSLAVQAAALSLSASFATLPLIWFHFGRISLVGPLANVVVEPLFVVAFAASLATAAAGLVSPELGWLAGLVAFYPLAFICWFAEWCAALPFAAISVEDISPTTALLAMLAFVALGALAYLRLAPSPAPRGSSDVVKTGRKVGWAAVAGGTLVAVVVVSVLPTRGPDELVVTFLDVGQGDAILVTTPDGRHVLVDGGPSGIEGARELGAVLPHWQRSIDTIVLTHPHQDHLAGLPEVLERFDVESVYDNGVANSTTAFAEYERLADSRTTLAGGSSFELDGVRFEVLWPVAPDPGDLNNSSVVIRVTYGATSVLLTADIEAASQDQLLDQSSADVLKVPHHGAGTSSAAFLDSTGATIAVISVGATNQFGHPDADTLDALAETTVFRTDLDGRVTIRSDGQTIRYSTER